jgi:hypothetical protein
MEKEKVFSGTNVAIVGKLFYPKGDQIQPGLSRYTKITLYTSKPIKNLLRSTKQA